MNSNDDYKFRIWFYDQKKFEYGGFEYFKKCSFPLHWCKIQQYTGLKDSKGKEIYEGDIVKDRWDIKSVRYDAHGYHPFKYYGGGEMCNTGCEVIGNIFENPELL